MKIQPNLTDELASQGYTGPAVYAAHYCRKVMKIQRLIASYILQLFSLPRFTVAKFSVNYKTTKVYLIV